jgi:hypothetical protein
VARKGAKCPIFEGNMPPKKSDPKIGADIGAITGILLMIISGMWQKNPTSRGKSHDQCWYLENPLFVLQQY